MSFSGEIKEELSRQSSSGRHCRVAETAAILSLCGKVLITESNQYCVKIQTENLPVARKYFTLLRKTFNIEAELAVRQNQRENTYTISVNDPEQVRRILQVSRLMPGEAKDTFIHSALVQRRCCKRAFLRGAFLSSGSISDPNKFYHFEVVCPSLEKAEQIREVIGCFEMEARIVRRKNHFVVYVKEGAQIVELLGIMGANVSVMNLENVRILKEMRGSVNRKVNCETANINKTVHAAVKQMEDIRFIQEKIGFSALPEGLEQIAKLRLEFPEATLAELGAMLSPAVGKSGVNHRLRKLKSIAEELKREQGGELL